MPLSALTWPPGEGQDASGYDGLFKITKALMDRAAVIGSPVWPTPHPPWASGTVQSVTTDDDGNYVIGCSYTEEWVLTVDGTHNIDRWAGYVPPEDAPGIPSSYDIVIEADRYKPWLTVRGPIIGQFPNSTDAGSEGSLRTVTITPTSAGSSQWGLAVQHAIIGGYLAGLGTLVGRKWYIIKRGGMWASDRMIERPNEHEAWTSTCTGGQVPYPTEDDDPVSYAEDTSDKTQWPVDKWVGYELLTFDGGALKRVTIEHNDANRLYFAAADWTAGGAFSIVETGRRGVPGRRKWRPGAWYRGAGETFFSRDPGFDSVVATATLAADKVYWNEYNVDSMQCENLGHPLAESTIGSRTALDNDLIIHSLDYQTKCDASRVDDFAAPHIHKSARHWQKTILDFGPSFVKTPPTGNQVAKMYYPAELLADLGLPSGTATLYRDSSLEDDDASATFDVSGAAIENGHIYYTVYDKDGTQHAGEASVPPSGKISPVPPFITPLIDEEAEPPTATNAGLSVLWSVGYRRYHPRRVRYLYPRTAWQPDVVYDGEGNASVRGTPAPSEVLDGDGYPTGEYETNGCGYFVRSGTSTNYAEFDEYGRIYDSGPALIAGDLVRVEGDNFGGPTLPELVGAGAPLNNPNRLKLAYLDLFYRGTYGLLTELQFHGGRSGTSTSGVGTNRLTDTSKNWWSDGVNGGELVAHTYTAVAGSSTSVTLDIDVTDHTDPSWTWFDPTRYVQMPSGKPFVDLTVHVIRAGEGDDPDEEHRFVVTDCVTTGGQVVISFEAEDGFTPDEDDTVILREPKWMPNKFEGRTVNLISPTNEKFTAVVRHNDDKNLWLDDVLDEGGGAAGPLTIGDGWQYSIGYIQPGVVLRRTSTGWAIPEGEDEARLGVASPADFVSKPANNLPTYVKKYGLHRRGDRILDNVMLTEIYRGIRLLKTIVTGVSFTPRSDPDVAENNYRAGGVVEATYSGYDFGYQTGDYPDFGSMDGSRSAAQGDLNYVVNNRGQIGDPPPAFLPSGEPTYYEYAEEERGGAPYVNSGIDVQLRFPSAVNSSTVGELHTAGASSAYAYGTVSGVPTRFPATVDFYNYAEGWGSNQTEDEQTWVFAPDVNNSSIVVGNSYGFNAASAQVAYLKWTNWDTKTIDADGRAKSGKLGDTDLIGFATLTDPPSTLDGETFLGAQLVGVSGYKVTKATATVTFDFDDDVW